MSIVECAPCRADSGTQQSLRLQGSPQVFRDSLVWSVAVIDCIFNQIQEAPASLLNHSGTTSLTGANEIFPVDRPQISSITIASHP